MAVLQLVYAPDPIFKQIAEPVDQVDDAVRGIVDDMFDTLYFEKAVGIGANMVGILKRIVAVDVQPEGKKQPLALINPEIIWKSDEKQTYLEASLSFPGIQADITRPKAIKVKYLDKEGMEKELELEGHIATVVQHEIDYLDGKVFLDYLSKLKRDTLLRKMAKHMKLNPPCCVSGVGCNH